MGNPAVRKSFACCKFCVCYSFFFIFNSLILDDWSFRLKFMNINPSYTNGFFLRYNKLYISWGIRLKISKKILYSNV